MTTNELPFEVTELDRSCAANVWYVMSYHDKGASPNLPAENTLAREAGAQQIAASRNSFVLDSSGLRKISK